MKPRDGLYFLLSLPSVYRLFRTIVQGDGCRVYVSEYVRPVPGEKVLDIGCGPGDILENVPAVDYLGFDINPKYVEAAQKRFGRRGRFFCGDVGLTAIDQEAASFDLVLATGVLHHLDDNHAVSLFNLARRTREAGGAGLSTGEVVRPSRSFADSLHARDFAVWKRGVIPFRLPSTPPLSDAVTFSYRQPWRRFLTAQLKTHVFQYLGSPLEDQAIEPILAAPGNLSPHDQSTECSHK